MDKRKMAVSAHKTLHELRRKGYTLCQIGYLIGVSQQAVSQHLLKCRSPITTIKVCYEPVKSRSGQVHDTYLVPITVNGVRYFRRFSHQSIDNL